MVVIDAGPGALSYLWQDNSTEQTFTVFQPGNYWVSVTNGCGSTTDTLQLSAGANEVFDLGPDEVLCGNAEIELNAGNDGISWLWSTGATSQTVVVDEPGTYWVDVADERGCYVSDSVTVSADSQAPVLTCPADTVGYVAVGGSMLFLALGQASVSDACPYALTNDFNNTDDARGRLAMVTWPRMRMG
ncbi:MAG: hypothetical protein IPN62_03685 [Flavobacteriales bacterium]|nr:hypothetical protein [Flavobacteriales bacterium]